MKKDVVIKYFGSQAKVAKALKISRQAVNKWDKTIPDHRACQIHIITKGEISHVNS